MASQWTSYIWKYRRDLHGSKLLCALALANLADQTGRCTPGFKKLAHEVRVSLRHVQFLISCLERKKVIQVRRGRSRGQLSVFQMIKDEGGLLDQVVKDESQNAVRPETNEESPAIVYPYVDLCGLETGPKWDDVE